jgi:hypothetical protein
MATHDYSNVNSYPFIKRVSIDDTATKIIIPPAATRVSIGSVSALHFANSGGDDGDSFVDQGDGITDFGFIPANNVLPIDMETGRQSNRELLIGTQSGSGYLSIMIEKTK